MKTFGHNLEREIDQFSALTDRTLAGMRFILAAGTLCIIYADPSEPDRYVMPTYATLIGYALYSLAIYAIARRCTNFSQLALRFLVWTDIAIFTALIALSSGTNSLFSFFYLFAIIVASSRGGMKLGLAATAASTLLFFAVDLASAMQDPYELNRFLMRRLAMSSLGYILAFWGGAELALKQRLALLKDLSAIANPRFGVDRTIEQMLRRLVNLYDADYGLMMLRSDSGFTLYRTQRDIPAGACKVEHVDPDLPIASINPLDPCATVYSERQGFWSRRHLYQERSMDSLVAVNRSSMEGEAAADLLGARSFVAVPVVFRDEVRGRLVIASRRRRNFEFRDATFLAQVLAQVFPVIENVRLVNHLAFYSAEEERRKIARSVHDRVIQPYYGLIAGLQGLHDLIDPEPGERKGKRREVALLKELMRMTSDGVEELRRYIQGLRQSDAEGGRLLDSIHSFAEKFQIATGIQVRVTRTRERFVIDEGLTADVFQMTAEALSNVQRHTDSRIAQVALRIEDGNLVLTVENETGDVEAPRTFSPASICERAKSLGGDAKVSIEDGRTIVRVEVPL